MSNLIKLIEILVEQVFQETQSSEPVRLSLSMPIPQDIKDLTEIFVQSGHKLYVVGGAVRDALLGKDPKDWDIATDAQPDRILEILEPHKQYRTLEIGKAFGVINVISPSGEEYEVATFRRDLSGGRRPDAVEFTDIATDVMRRDLTINALFYDLETGEVVDYVGGIEDLKNGVVRSVGNPVERFDEDRLRILRAVRFAARMGSQLDPDTEKAIRDNNSLSGVSPERIRDEFLKGFKSAKSVNQFIKIISSLGLWSEIFPNLSISSDSVDESNRNELIFLAELLRDNSPERVRSTLNKLKYSAQETAAVAFLLMFKDLDVSNAIDLWKINSKQVRLDPDTLKLFSRIFGSPSQKLVEAFLEYSPSVSSEDLIKQGLSGKELGQKIKELETQRFQALL
jgi:tRNA nucleotidyltransferase/poly(A) polymerase